MTDQPQAQAAEAELPSLDFLSTNLDLVSRTLYVPDIDDGVGDHLLKCLHLLLMASQEPVHLIINSRGGSLVDAMGVYDAIRTAGTTVTCEVFAHCMSAAVLIAQACDRRLIHKNALVMLHNPSHNCEGDSFSFENWAKLAVKQRRQIYQLLASHTTKPVSYWKRACSRGDRIWTSDEAVECGLFDVVIEHD